MKTIPLLGIAATVGLTSLAMNLFNPTIAVELKKEGVKLLSLNDDKGWEIKIKEYSESKTKDINKKSSLSKEELKEWCSLNLNKSPDEDNKDLQEKAKKWCSRPKTMEDHVSKEYKVSFLSEKDIDSWKKKVENYSDFWRIIGFYDDISITGDKKKILKQDMTVSKLKIWCSHKKEEYYSPQKTFSERRTLAKWCTNYQY